MIEVFKTNVKENSHANLLIDQIHKTFKGHKANFDLEDCDKILRVKYPEGLIEPALLIQLLNDFGFYAEVLCDNLQPVSHLITSNV